jgi:hypothetical protein
MKITAGPMDIRSIEIIQAQHVRQGNEMKGNERLAQGYGYQGQSHGRSQVSKRITRRGS